STASSAKSSRPPASVSAARLAALRARRFRQLPSLRVRGPRAARAFVEDVGFCSTFHCFAEGVPCLWEAVAGRAAPRWPRHSHHDAAIGLTWQLKDDLPAGRHVYFGKILRGRPCLVALDVFPAFYALIRGRQRARDYRMEYAGGRLTQSARRIMDALAAGRRLTRAAAAQALVERYLRAAVFTRPAVLRRLFGLSEREAAASAAVLTKRGTVVETAVAGWTGRWLVDASAVRSKKGRRAP